MLWTSAKLVAPFSVSVRKRLRLLLLAICAVVAAVTSIECCLPLAAAVCRAVT